MDTFHTGWGTVWWLGKRSMCHRCKIRIHRPAGTEGGLFGHSKVFTAKCSDGQLHKPALQHKVKQLFQIYSDGFKWPQFSCHSCTMVQWMASMRRHIHLKEERLHLEMVAQIAQKGEGQVDLFANAKSTQCCLWFSLADPDSLLRHNVVLIMTPK